MYQSGGTIKNALDRIASNEYVLPAIQREFVWGPEQICALFDSLMQGYPFGEFLFWIISAEDSAKYKYYGFVREYHERDRPHCPDLGVLHGKPLTPVLDGQQRLTAFNIGLRGSLAIKLPKVWRKNPGAFPERFLALDLLADTQRDEEGNRYEFDFVVKERIGRQNDRLWFPVSEILTMESAPDMLKWISDKNLDGEQQEFAFSTLDRLRQVVWTEPTIAYYEERNQDIEHVLNIFIRRNSGGTVLAYSDLLLSIAVSQWDSLDARKEVHDLVDDLNNIGSGLGLSKDFVLKAGLMLTDIASVGFRVRNFTHENMRILEENWTKIRAALVETVQLVTNFGFDSSSVRATSAILPIAYYIYRIGAPADFDSHSRYATDRQVIRGWLTRSLLKAGIWGGGLDTLLTALRDIIRTKGADHFPATEMRAAMARSGKSLEFTVEEIQDLAEVRIRDREVFALLSLIYPFIDLRAHQFHIDHVFPKSRFTWHRLRTAGVEEEEISRFVDCADRIANLQLLEGVINNEKRAKLPADWIQEYFTDDEKRRHYREQYLLGEVPRDITSFMSFYEARRERLQKRIADLVNSV